VILPSRTISRTRIRSSAMNLASSLASLHVRVHPIHIQGGSQYLIAGC
jgi:hypothetical protein